MKHIGTAGEVASVAPDHASLQQAAQRFADFDGGRGLDSAARADLQQWLDQDPRNRSAWACVEAVSADFGHVVDPAARAALRQPARDRRHAMRTLGALAVIGTSGVGGWLATRSPWPDAQSLAGSARTGTGEVRTLALAGRSQAWLNANTSVSIENSDTERVLRLDRGEVFVVSEHSGADLALRRPLVVVTPQGRAEALGTRFNVRSMSDGTTQVAVFDGAVRLKPRSGSAAVDRTLETGEQARFSDERIAAVEPASASRKSWIDGLLVADHMRLDEFLAELSNYRRGHLGCDPLVAGLRLSGVFPVTDADNVLRMLEKTLPVRVSWTTPWWVSVSPVR